MSVSRPERVLRPPPIPYPLSTVSLKGKMCGGRDERAAEHGQRKTTGKIQMKGREKEYTQSKECTVLCALTTLNQTLRAKTSLTPLSQNFQAVYSSAHHHSLSSVVYF